MAHNFYESKTMPDLQEMDINVMKEKAKKRFLQENSPLRTNAERAEPSKKKHEKTGLDLTNLKLPAVSEICVEELKEKRKARIFNDNNAPDDNIEAVEIPGMAEETLSDITETESSDIKQAKNALGWLNHSMPDLPDMAENQVWELINKRKLDIHQNTVFSLPEGDNKDNSSSDIPASQRGKKSLYECSEELIKKVDFVIKGSKLYYYDGKCYKHTDKNGIIRIYREYVDERLGNERSMSLYKQLESFIMTSPSGTIPKISAAPSLNYAVFRNGIYDIENDTLLKHSSELPVFSCLNAKYVENPDCPVFDRFLDDITGGSNKLKFRFLQFLGYTFSLNRKAKCFFYLGTERHSGKSQLGNFIMNVVPPEYCSNIALTKFGKDYELSTIFDMSVNLSLDLPNKALTENDVSLLKMMTGYDSAQINIKYETPKAAKCSAALIFAGNHALKIKGDDMAFWDRCIYLPCKSVPEEYRDPELLERLIEEKDDIVSRCVKFVAPLIKNNYKFMTTDHIEATIGEWSGKQCKSADLFFNKYCRVNEQYSTNREAVSVMYSVYTDYCKKISCVPLTQTLFMKYIRDNKCVKHVKLTVRGKGQVSAFEGIKLLTKK